jgi:hypothetical protein
VSTSDLQKFPAGTQDKGISSYTPNIAAEITWANDSVNMTSGLNQGAGPRYGMAPIPGHMDQETPNPTGCAGMMAAEVTTGSFWRRVPSGTRYVRRAIYAMYPFRMGGPGTSINVKSTYYGFLLGFYPDPDNSVPVDKLHLDFVFGAFRTTVGSDTTTEQSPYIYSPLGWPVWTAVESYRSPSVLPLASLYLSSNTSLNGYSLLTDLGAIATPKWFVSSTPFSVNGAQIPIRWLVGTATATGDATHPPSLNFSSYDSFGSSNNSIIAGGFPPSFNYGNFLNISTSAAVYALHDGGFNINYSASFTPTTSIYKPMYIELGTTVQADFSATAFTKDTGGTTYSNTDGGLLNDPNLLCDSSYQGVLVATGSAAVCYLIQDWFRSRTGAVTQAVDLVNMGSEPRSVGFYTQDATNTPSPFTTFPAFVRGTAISAGSSGIGLGGANTGLLQSNTVYEFAYSNYDKRLNFESNVSIPVKFQVGTDNNNSLLLFVPPMPPQTPYQVSEGGTAVLMPFPGTASVGATVVTAQKLAANYLEYRFYYREEGMQEWLPALFIDAAQFWFYPQFVKLAACTGGIGGLPGGRPNGFSDYSRLPQDSYTCAVFYKNRAFWLSDKSLAFSLANNIFAYPQRNRATCPLGSFKGAITQAYYGQAQQDARLVVFGTEATYVGKFTGEQIEVPVQVSIDTVGNYGLDGSDFVLNLWTTVTAFSYRAAIVAEGILFLWGPQGIFMDNGVDPLTPISRDIEPDLFSYYDASLTDDITCTYDSTTKEITWFYPPKTADSSYPTHSLIYDLRTQKFKPGKFAGWIDGTMPIKIDTAIPTAGSRNLVFSRASSAGTTQRAYFFDHLNRAGDIFPGKEMMVSAVSTPATGQRTFTLAKGYTTDFSTIAAGDLISVSSPEDYDTSLATPSDFIGEVLSSATGTNPTITIRLPTGAEFDASATIAASANYKYFPIWHATQTGNGLNGFPYVMSTNYWLPDGLSNSWYWVYLYLLFKYTGVPSPADPFTGKMLASKIDLTYRSLVCQAALTDQIYLENNSDGQCQIHHPMRNVGRAGSGQALKYKLSGVHIGNYWTLEYVEAHCKKEAGFTLKEFEG